MEGEDCFMAKEKKSDLFLKIASVILSFAIWVYIINVENPTKTMKVYNVPVKLENLANIEDQKLALLPNQEIMVTLNVKGPASEVYRTVASDFRVVADLNDLALKKGINEVPIEITSYPSGLDISQNTSVKAIVQLDDYVEREVSVISDYVASPDLGSYVGGITVNPGSATIKGPAEYVNSVTSLLATGSKDKLIEDYKEIVALVPVDENGNTVSNIIVSPLYVEVNVQVFNTKKVPINITSEGKLNDGLDLKALTVEPAEITIAGPDKILEQIKSIDTEKIMLTTITETKDLLQGIILPTGVIAVNGESRVTVHAEVEVFGTKTVSKKLTTIGIADGLEALLSSNSINIIMSGTTSKLNEVTEESITAELDLTGLGEGSHEITPRIVLPVGVVETSHSPQIISVTITKKVETPIDAETP